MAERHATTSEPRAPGTKTRVIRIVALAAATLLVAAACASNASTRPQTGASAPAPSPAAPTAAPSSAAVSATPGADTTLALGQKVFQTAGGIGCRTCHGDDAKGKALDSGGNAPNIRGATEKKLRDALAGGAAPMAFLKLKDEEIEAVIKYLGSLD